MTPEISPLFLSLLGWVAFWFAGLLAGCLLLIPAVSFLRFGLPATRSLQRQGLLTSGGAVLGTQVLAATWRLAALAALTTVVGMAARLVPHYPMVFLFALGLETMIRFRRTGWTAANVQAYVEAHRERFTQPIEVIEELWADAGYETHGTSSKCPEGGMSMPLNHGSPWRQACLVACEGAGREGGAGPTCASALH